MKLFFKVVLLFTVVCLCASTLFGQGTTGSVSGTVKDQTGAFVAGATVKATNIATGFVRSDASTQTGTYILQGLPPGTYQLTVTAKGFAKVEQKFDVTVASKSNLDFSLRVGSETTVVEVVGAGENVVNTTNQEVSSVVTSQQMSTLPTLTRNPYDLVAVSPNVTQDSQAGVGEDRGAGYSINGQRSASTSVLLDGGENVDLFTASVGQTVPLDSVQEFRVISNGMTAEYGRATGGVVNVATKSGTNVFHGTAYEFNRVAALASNTYDNAANGTDKPGFTRNQFGFSVGGPIKKNKLFFFDNTEWIRVRSSGIANAIIIDPAFLALSNANTKDYFSTYGTLKSGIVSKDTYTVQQTICNFGGCPNASGKITNPAGPLLSALPGTTPMLQHIQYQVPSDAGGGTPQNTWMTSGKVDWNVSDKTQFFARYSYFDRLFFEGSVNDSPYAGYDTGQTDRNQNLMLSLTHTFTTNLLSNSRFIYARLNNTQPLGTNAVSPTLYLTNAVAGSAFGYRTAFPGYNEYTPGNAIPFGGPQNLFQFYEDMNWNHGKHSFRFGGQYIFTQDNRMFGAYEASVQALSTNNKSAAWDNFLAGNVGQFQGAVYPQGKYPCNKNASGSTVVTPACTLNLPVGPPSFSRSNLYNDWAAYFQDTWKMTNRLTLNLGIRWEYYGVQHNRDPNLDSNFYMGTGSNIWDRVRNGTVTTTPQSTVGGLWRPDFNNWAPRFGFAYDVFGNGKTSLRGGYGIAYERNFGNVTYNVIQNPPNYGVVSLTAGSDLPVIPITTNNYGPLGGTSGTKALPAVSLRYVDDHIDTAYAQQWNLGVEHQIRPNVIASVAYNGSRGVKQYSISNLNEAGFGSIYLGDVNNTRLNTQYSNINTRGSSGDSYYNALVMSLNGTLKDLTWTANWTYAHAIDTLSSTFSGEVQNNGLGYVNPFDPGLDRGSSDYDARHRIAISAVYSMPFGKSASSKAVKAIIGGWQVAPIFSYRTGYPYTVFDCTNSFSPYNCPRANLNSATFQNGGSASVDVGGNLWNYLAVNSTPGEYSGPTVVPGTSTPLPGSILGNSILPTCTGLYGQGCQFPANMSHRSAFVGPGNWNFNFGVYKDFSLTERFKLQFRSEFYDLFNTKNFYIYGFGFGGADVSSLDTNAAGLPVVQAKKGGYGNPYDDHRNIQFALKLTF